MHELSELFRLATKGKSKWGLFLVVIAAGNSLKEMLKAVPFLDRESGMWLRLNGQMAVFFDTEADLQACYQTVVGDDGPTPTNPYNGKARIYALTCDPHGNLLCENT